MIPMSVTVGPLATADADGICASQIATAAGGMAINGLLSTGFDADAIAQAQAVGSATTLTLNGVLVKSGVAYLPDASGIVTITSAGDDHTITFTVVGLKYSLNGNVGVVSEVVTGTNASIAATTKTFSTVTSVTSSGAAAGNVSVGISGTVTLDEPRRILLTTGADETGITFTITGTDWNNQPISEVLAGVDNSTAYTVYDFSTVTSITVDDAMAGAVTIGTNGVASSRPIFFDEFAFPQISLQLTIDGTANATVQQTVQDMAAVGYANISWVDHPDSDFVAATTTAQANYAYAPSWARVTLNSGTGSANLTAIQAANVPL